jgi:ribosomal-protein-alanine N-acetyltransferase
MSPTANLPFDGGFVRPLLPVDAHAGYVTGLNDPEVNHFLDGVKWNVQTLESVRDFISLNESDPHAILWGIWRTEDDKHCGTIRLHSIEHHHRTAHIGICIFNKSCWGKGLGSRAIRVVTHWALSSLALRWIEAGAYAKNIASQKLFLSAGYRPAFDINGKYLLDGVPTTVNVFAATADLPDNKSFSHIAQGAGAIT